jgi:DNA polymerase-3 subunit delta
MPSAAIKSLKEVLKHGVTPGAYYLAGDDDFQKEEAMKRLIEVAVDPTTREFNLDLLRAQDLNAKSLEGILTSLPMMANHRVVVIRDAGSLKRDADKVLRAFLKKPSSDLVLILVEASGGKTDKDLQKLTTVFEFTPLSADDVPNWITQRAKKQFKTAITPRAADLLQNALGNDLQHLVTELDKLSSYTNGKEITEEAVAEVTGVKRGETVTDLLDAIGYRDVGKALKLVNHVLAQPKTSGVQLIMLLSVQTIAIAWARAKLDEGLSQGRLQGAYFDLLKQSGGVYIGRPWGAAVSAWSSMTSAWTAESLNRAINALLVADDAIKESRISSEEEIITSLVLTMCAEDENRIAA